VLMTFDDVVVLFAENRVEMWSIGEVVEVCHGVEDQDNNTSRVTTLRLPIDVVEKHVLVRGRRIHSRGSI
jgi:hypothetical protein